MSSDNSNKTVFRNGGSHGGDHTVMRPTPGGRGYSDTPSSTNTTNSMTDQYSQNSEPYPPNHNHDNGDIFSNAKGLNPLVNAAAPLIAVYRKIRQASSHNNIGGLHKKLVSEIRDYEAKIRTDGAPNEVALSTRYIICTALDEAVMNTPWGMDSPWGQHTLLSLFHKELSGGEKFFMILERMKQSPSQNLHILEMFYIFLSLGYEGKYRLDSRGRDALEQIRDELFSTIRRNRGEYERALSDKWQGLGRTNNTLTSFIPMWVIATIVVAILFFSYSGFRYWLYKSATPVSNELQTISQDSERLQNQEKDVSDNL